MTQNPTWLIHIATLAILSFSLNVTLLFGPVNFVSFSSTGGGLWDKCFKTFFAMIDCCVNFRLILISNLMCHYGLQLQGDSH